MSGKRERVMPTKTEILAARCDAMASLIREIYDLNQIRMHGMAAHILVHELEPQLAMLRHFLVGDEPSQLRPQRPYSQLLPIGPSN